MYCFLINPKQNYNVNTMHCIGNNVFNFQMDLMHLLSTESSSEQEPGQWREVLYKRKGINFSTTTSEGRLLRSSQVRRLFSFSNNIYKVYKKSRLSNYSQ